jgi:hypothetical protein
MPGQQAGARPSAPTPPPDVPDRPRPSRSNANSRLAATLDLSPALNSSPTSPLPYEPPRNRATDPAGAPDVLTRGRTSAPLRSACKPRRATREGVARILARHALGHDARCCAARRARAGEQPRHRRAGARATRRARPMAGGRRAARGARCAARRGGGRAPPTPVVPGARPRHDRAAAARRRFGPHAADRAARTHRPLGRARQPPWPAELLPAGAAVPAARLVGMGHAGGHHRARPGRPGRVTPHRRAPGRHAPRDRRGSAARVAHLRLRDHHPHPAVEPVPPVAVVGGVAAGHMVGRL